MAVIFKTLTIISLTLLISGCGYFSQFDNLKNSANLRVGMTKDEVLSVMGNPIDNEIFVQPNVWYYYVNTQWHDGLTTEDECMPLIFVDGKLIGWGNDFFNRKRLENKHKF